VSSKRDFRVPSFLTKPPPYVFLGPCGPFSAFGGKNYFAPKLLSILPPKPPKSLYGAIRIFLPNRTTITIGAKRSIWREWGQNCFGTKFCVFEKARLRSEFFD
jgi:hypothetical protein